jgi:isocitrate/isopropylmalate dehydrogenase
MKTLLLLPGDGIGPEVCAELRGVVESFQAAPAKAEMD